MAQHDYDIANQSGSSFRSDLNNCLDAIQSQNSGSSEPSTTVAFMPWADTNANLIKFRNAANDGFITLCATDGTFPAKTFTGDVTLNAQSDLRFADSDSSNWVAFQAPATVSSNVTWTLPDADATTSGQALVSDGSGTLSWATAGGGDISDTAPERTFTNTTEENTNGGRESKITFKGERGSGAAQGEVSTLAQIEASHDGTSDDQKGQLRFKVNDGSDGSTPTDALTIDSAGNVGIATTEPGAKLEVAGNDILVNSLRFGRGPGGNSDSTVIGRTAGNNLTSGETGNTFIGSGCGGATETGTYNLGVGFAALGAGSMSGQENIGIGSRTGQSLTSGDGNVCVGREAGKQLGTGSHNTFIGPYAGYYGSGSAASISGNMNVAIGYSAGSVLQGGSENVLIGDNAAASLTSGNNNVIIGEGAGASLVGGGNNTLLGHGAGSSGSPSGAVTGTHVVCLGNSNVTDLFCADTTISSSDQRDKADITDFTHGLDWVTQMRPVTYKWDKRDWYVDWEENPDTDLNEVTTDGTHKKDRINLGLLAQDVQAIEQADGFSTCCDDQLIVKSNCDEKQLGLKYERLVPVLINAIKELKTANDALTARVAALEAA